MDSFLKMDIFFIVTTCAVVILTVLLGLVTWRIFRILEHVEHISEQAAREADALRVDLAELRGSIKREGFALAQIARFVKSLVVRTGAKSPGERGKGKGAPSN